jgi:hypothetical protein
MYIQDRNPHGLTESEALWEKTSWERVKALITAADKVVDSSRGCNNYGEFRFVTVVKDGSALTMYGHGYHEYREAPVIETWYLYGGNGLSAGRPALDKRKVLKELNFEHETYKLRHAGENKQNRTLFAHLADELGDEDAVFTELEDRGLLYAEL